MGFLDKAKEAAAGAVANAQQMAQQGQAKLDGYQSGKSEGELYRALGEAFFAEQRRGADRSGVIAALAALDEHFAAAAAQAAQPAPAAAAPAYGAAPPAYGATPAAPAPAAPPTSGAATAAPAGNFTLDDL
jgi:hypothetical protein